MLIGIYAISYSVILTGQPNQNSKSVNIRPLQQLPLGTIEWQNTIGGNAGDLLASIQQTSDGGYILGGSSSSDISDDKIENSQGGYDYWVVKLDISGNFQWQNTIGGSLEEFNSFVSKVFEKGVYIQQTSDGGYILGNYSNSNISGDKTENRQGDFDYGVVKLAGDCIPISISTHPTNQQAFINGTATFNVVAGGSAPFIYQWKKNGINVTGATNALYNTPALTTLNNGNLYNCVIKNCNGAKTITSNNGMLTVCSCRQLKQASSSLHPPAPVQLKYIGPMVMAPGGSYVNRQSNFYQILFKNILSLLFKRFYKYELNKMAQKQQEENLNYEFTFWNSKKIFS